MIGQINKTARQWLPLAILLPCIAAAQDELLNEEQAEIKLYTVEVIVFRYTEDVSVGSEIFPPETPAAADSEAVAEIAVRPLPRRHPDFIGLEPVLLSEQQLTLQKTLAQLELLDAYEPILHVGWTQPGYPLSDVVVMPLSAFGTPPAGLDGNFTLYLSRFLHLVVDLSLTPPDSTPEYADEFGTVRQFEYALPPTQGPVRFGIREDRIFKSDEIRYFDHPKFGVIAKVQRVAAAQDPAALRPPLIGQAQQ